MGKEASSARLRNAHLEQEGERCTIRVDEHVPRASVCALGSACVQNFTKDRQAGMQKEALVGLRDCAC